MSEHNVTGVCGSRGCTVSYSCINTKSADVKVLLTSSIFHPALSRPPCCSSPHDIQLCRVKGLESRAPLRPPAFGHLCLRESSAVSALWPTCITQWPHTRLQNNIICPRPDKLRPEDILSTDCMATLMVNFSSDWTMLKLRYVLQRRSPIRTMNHAT